MTSLETIWSVASDKDRLYVRWMNKVWKVHQKTPFGFILADANGMKAYITLISKQKLFELAREEDFKK